MGRCVPAALHTSARRHACARSCCARSMLRAAAAAVATAVVPACTWLPCRLCTGHANIVQLIEVFLTPRFLAIVLEYAPGGDLLEYVTSKGHLSGDP